MSAAWLHELIPILSLTGVILNGLGGLYLAYELLGGKNGPLRTASNSVIYGVIFGSAYGLVLGVWFGLAGLVVSGFTLSQEIGRRSFRGAHPFVEALAFGLPRAASSELASRADSVILSGNLLLVSAYMFMALIRQTDPFLIVAELAGIGWTISASELWMAAQRSMPSWARGRMCDSDHDLAGSDDARGTDLGFGWRDIRSKSYLVLEQRFSSHKPFCGPSFFD